MKQKGIVRVVKSANYIQINSQDKVAQAANLAFDAAQLECWLAWANGASLVIIDKDILLDYKLFDEKLLNENVTVFWLTAALFHQCVYTKPTIFSNLKYLLAGGDVVEKKAMQEVFSCSNNNSLNLAIGCGRQKQAFSPRLVALPQIYSMIFILFLLASLLITQRFAY